MGECNDIVFYKFAVFQSVFRRSLELSDTNHAAYCLLSSFQSVPHYYATDDILYRNPPNLWFARGYGWKKWAAFQLSFAAVWYQELYSQCNYLYMEYSDVNDTGLRLQFIKAKQIQPKPYLHNVSRFAFQDVAVCADGDLGE